MPRPSSPRPSDHDAEAAEGSPHTDGRRRRGEDNRRRISQAFIALVAEGVVTPTAGDVAYRAGVGLRSVFRHFTDMETLYREMASHSERLTRQLADDLPRSTDWEHLLEAVIEARASVYEQVMPFQIAAQVHQYESAHLRAHQVSFADLQRARLLEVLPKEFLRDKAILEALNLALSFDTWLRLRRDQRLNRATAKRVITLTCTSLLRDSAARP